MPDVSRLSMLHFLFAFDAVQICHSMSSPRIGSTTPAIRTPAIPTPAIRSPNPESGQRLDWLRTSQKGEVLSQKGECTFAIRCCAESEPKREVLSQKAKVLSKGPAHRLKQVECPQALIKGANIDSSKGWRAFWLSRLKQRIQGVDSSKGPNIDSSKGFKVLTQAKDG